jgi:hypothetical protein
MPTPKIDTTANASACYPVVDRSITKWIDSCVKNANADTKACTLLHKNLWKDIATCTKQNTAAANQIASLVSVSTPTKR